MISNINKFGAVLGASLIESQAWERQVTKLGGDSLNKIDPLVREKGYKESEYLAHAKTSNKYSPSVLTNTISDGPKKRPVFPVTPSMIKIGKYSTRPGRVTIPLKKPTLQ